MNRKDQLKYCSICLNRKFDSQQGIICNLTAKPADFVETCGFFEVDESMKNQKELEKNKDLPADSAIALLPEEVKVKLRVHQNLGFAAFGGSISALFAAILWAVISVATQYQISWMAIGIGFLVGYSVRFFGAGIDKKFGVLGGILAVISCLLGNLFCQVGFYANEEGLPFAEVLGYLTPSLSFGILVESFEPVDLLFYGFAAYAGYKYAFRKVPAIFETHKDYTPKASKFRMPLAFFSGLLIGLFFIFMSLSAEVDKEYYYESGALLSKGKLKNGLADGIWEYYDEDGIVKAKGNFLAGREDGKWEYYDEEGKIASIKNLYKGFLHGDFKEFFPSGALAQEGHYTYDRMDSEWISYYEDGQIQNRGHYILDLPEGEWQFFFPNGKLNQKGFFKNGEKNGVWLVYNENEEVLEESNHLDEGEVEWINFQNVKSRKNIINGYGEYVIYHESGEIAVSGKVSNKKMTGEWTFNNELDEGQTIVSYENGKSKLMLYKGNEGKILVRNGNGQVITYYQSGMVEEEGIYIDGVKDGKWVTYYDEKDLPLMEVSNFTKGMLEGPYTFYHYTGYEAIEGKYYSGKKTGTWKWYFESGLLESEVDYEAGFKNGKQYFYNEGGQILKTEIYEKGKLVETILP
jgi:antitoxin component YwqK of YwqJK toxin-antitoxin module